MSFVEAKSYVKEKRACVNPNGGFIEQLKSYEGILKARCVYQSILLVYFVSNRVQCCEANPSKSC